MRCLVTGGAGFIGSHLVELLIKEGHKVIVLDNLSTGRMENLEPYIYHNTPNFAMYQIDITQLEWIRPYFENVDWVFHLAGLADIVPSVKYPLAYHHANVDGTVSVLEASRLAGVKRFIYTASSSCYGITDELPTPETATCKPEYPYALSKYIGEQYVLHWGKVYGLPVVSLRLFNVYGLRSRTSGAYGAVFGVFLAQKLHNQPFTVIGDGYQKRDFTYVSDVARALLMAAQSDLCNEVLNVGSSQPESINYLTELLGGDVVHIPKRTGEPDCTWADTSKIYLLLGWDTKVLFEDGVKVLLDNIDCWKDAPLWTPETIKKTSADWFKYLK